MGYKLEFFRPQEAIRVEVQLVEAFLHKAFARREVRWVSWERWKREEQVFRDVADGVEFFRKCGGDGADFLVHCLVFEDEGRIGGWKWQEQMRCDNLFRWRWCGWRRVIDNGDDFDCWRTSGMRVCQDIHPAGDVSGIAHGNFYLSAQEIFESAEEGLLEGTSEEEAKRGVLGDVCMDFE